MGQKKLHLQGLRGFAIVAVVLFHFFPGWCPNGYLGVDQFFLLSGFLMTMMLHRHSSLNITVILDFLYRRVKRIVPLYYLATALTLVSINLMPKSAFNTNFTSAIHALLFVTNLVRPLGMEDYAEKLGLAVDMFTHTWSLALEMQFYLLFPVIHIVMGYFTGNRKNHIIIALGAVSLAFYLLSDSFISFNSVFSRIWQFLAGMLVFLNLMENSNSAQLRSLEKQRLTEEEEENSQLKKLVRSITAVSVGSMTLLIFGPTVIDPLVGRLNTILLTGLIVYLGEGSFLLENELLVFLGEISYCWYLVHWPVVALCKINGFGSEIELFYAMTGSFLISLIIHYGFERFYLKWEKRTTTQFLFILLVVNGVALHQIYGRLPSVSLETPVTRNNASHREEEAETPFIFASDHLELGPMGYENMTNETRAQLNEQFDARDMGRLHVFPCVNRIKTNISKEVRCQVGEKKNITGKPPLTLLVIGNSYAQNVMGVVHTECRDVFSSIYISAIGGCEPLYRTVLHNFDCAGVDGLFQAAAEEIKPDVLFIIPRHMNGMEITNGTNPFDDQNFATAINRLAALEKLVKKKIFILDAFPPFPERITWTLNDYLRHGRGFKDSELLDFGPRFLAAKQRMYRLVQGCSKCELFDYATQFYINREFKIYDPKYHVAYFTKARHLTPPGLERVRPLIRHICHHL